MIRAWLTVRMFLVERWVRYNGWLEETEQWIARDV